MGSLLAAGLSEDPRPWDSVPGSLGGCGPKDHSSQALGEELVLWEAGRGLAPREVAVSRWGGRSLKAPVARLMLRSAVTADGTSWGTRNFWTHLRVAQGLAVGQAGT